MATLKIGERSVTVDDSFLKLSTAEQNAAVEEIAASLGSPAPAAPPQKTLNDLPDMLDPSGPDYNRRHGGSLVTGMADAIGGAVTAPGRVARGEIQMTDPATGHVSDEGIGTGVEMAAALSPTSPAANLVGRGAQAGARALERPALPPPASAFPKGAPKAAAEAGQTLSRDEIKQASQQAYKASEDSGVFIKPHAVQRMSSEIKNDFAEFGYKPRLAPKVAGFLDDLDAAVADGQTHTLKSMDMLRQEAGLIMRSTEPAEREIGRQVLKKIDKHLDTLNERDVLEGGDLAKGIKSLREAQSLWKTQKKSEIIQTAVQRAEDRTTTSGSGGNIDNNLRQQLRRIVESPRLSRSFSRKEITAMRAIMRGSKVQDVARLLGKLSPEGNGLMAMLHLIAAPASGYLSVPAAGVGIAAKRYADSVTPKRIAKLDEMIRTIKRPRS